MLGPRHQLAVGRVAAVVEQAHHVAVLAAVDDPEAVARRPLALERLLVEGHEVLAAPLALATDEAVEVRLLVHAEPPPHELAHDLACHEGRGAAHAVADLAALVEGAQVRVRRTLELLGQLASLHLRRRRRAG